MSPLWPASLVGWIIYFNIGKYKKESQLLQRVTFVGFWKEEKKTFLRTIPG